MTARSALGPHVLSSKHKAIDSLQIDADSKWLSSAMSVRIGLRRIMGHQAGSDVGRRAVVTGTMKPDRSRSGAENKDGPPFGNGTGGSLAADRSLLLTDHILTIRQWMWLCNTTTHTHTHSEPDQSPINVAPGFLLAFHGRWDVVGRHCLVTVNSPLLAKIIYAQDQKGSTKAAS